MNKERKKRKFFILFCYIKYKYNKIDYYYFYYYYQYYQPSLLSPSNYSCGHNHWISLTCFTENLQRTRTRFNSNKKWNSKRKRNLSLNLENVTLRLTERSRTLHNGLYTQKNIIRCIFNSKILKPLFHTCLLTELLGLIS